MTRQEWMDAYDRLAEAAPGWACASCLGTEIEYLLDDPAFDMETALQRIQDRYRR